VAKSDDKEKALDTAIGQIERQHGKGAIMRLGSDDARVTPPAISTGALNLDAATGIGGIPRGRVTEIYGPEASGKTTLCLHIIANAQKDGGVAAFIDAEHALDVEYARKLGVDTENLLVSQPDTGEQALEIAEVLVRSGALDCVVVDSVAALVPKAEIEGEMGDSHVGLQARLMSQAMRKLTGAIGRSDTALIFTNQIREKIGVMFGCFQYGTRVTLADGTSEKIGKIVDQRLDVEVLSYDPETGRVGPRRVVNWFDNGRADRFLQFEVEGGPSGPRHFAATENHVVFTPGGPRRAGEIRAGDEVLAVVEDHELTVTEDRAQLVPGGAHGDGSLRRTGTPTASFRVGDGETASAAPTAVRRPLRTAPAKVLRRYEKPRTRCMRKFDLEVEGDHTYLVDGVVVHNSPETTSGGRALKFYASLRLDIRRIASIKEGDEQVGSRTRVKVVKNKCAPPFKQAEFDIMFNEGISEEGLLIDLGEEAGVVDRAGAWYSYGEDVRLGQGRENSKQFLKENPEIAAEIKAKVMADLGIGESVEGGADAEDGGKGAESEDEQE